MKLIWAILFNLIDVSVIVISGTYLIIKALDYRDTEKSDNELSENDKMMSAYQVFIERFNLIRQKFWVSFTILEISLILFFIFWDIIWYFGIRFT